MKQLRFHIFVGPRRTQLGAHALPVRVVGNVQRLVLPAFDSLNKSALLHYLEEIRHDRSAFLGPQVHSPARARQILKKERKREKGKGKDREKEREQES